MRQDRVLLGQLGRGLVSGVEAKGIETPYLQLVLRRVRAEERGAGPSVLQAATLNRLGGAGRSSGPTSTQCSTG